MFDPADRLTDEEKHEPDHEPCIELEKVPRTCICCDGYGEHLLPSRTRTAPWDRDESCYYICETCNGEGTV